MTESSPEGPTPPDDGETDSRLDTKSWHVFGHRFPRRWSVYARLGAGVLLLVFLGWWFTGDVTYKSNVKVSGLDASPPEYQEPLEEIARDFAGLVNLLADDGYGWRSGGLPSLRTGSSLSAEERTDVVALASVGLDSEVQRLATGSVPTTYRNFLDDRNWTPPDGETSGLNGFHKEIGALKATIHLGDRRSESGGRPGGRLQIAVRRR